MLGSSSRIWIIRFFLKRYLSWSGVGGSHSWESRGGVGGERSQIGSEGTKIQLEQVPSWEGGLGRIIPRLFKWGSREVASVHPYTRHLLNDEVHPLYLVLKLKLHPAPVLPLSPSEGSREVVPWRMS